MFLDLFLVCLYQKSSTVSAGQHLSCSRHFDVCGQNENETKIKMLTSPTQGQ